MNVTHHVVYSTKGGCGKTAFSLFLSQCEKSCEFCKNEKKDADDKEIYNILTPFLFDKALPEEVYNLIGLYNSANLKVSVEEIVESNVRQSVDYFIDFDLLGSSLQHSSNLREFNMKKLVTLQDIIRGCKKICDIQKLPICHDGTNTFKDIYILPVGVRESEKEMFHVKRYNTPLLRYEEMQKQLFAIQQDIIVYHEIENKKRAKNEEKEIEDIHIVYDLPPNADSYTDAVFYELFKRIGNNEKEKIMLYLVSNSGHMLKCNLDWLHSFCATHKFRECPVIIINNDNVGSFGSALVSLDAVSNSMDYTKINREVRNSIKALLYFQQGAIRVENFNADISKASALNIKPIIILKDTIIFALYK